MKPVMQRYLVGGILDEDDQPTDQSGDCFAACIASLLEVDLDEAFPNFHEDRDGLEWWQRWDAYLYEQYRAKLVFFDPPSPDETQNLAYWIATHGGPAPHACVWYRDEFVHNPWPGAASDGSDLGPVVEGCSVYSLATILRSAA